MSKTYHPKTAKVKTKQPRDDWHQTMLDRAHDAFTFDTEQRRQCVNDMKFAFVSGNQWDQHLTAKRRHKPNYEFNRIRQLIRRVTGQQLKNKPNIKVRAVEDNDVDTAEVLNGLIKNIEVQSSAETAYDTAFQWACGGGYGVIRVVSEYEKGDSFDQCLRIRTVADPMTTWCDPSAREFDRSDARFWFIGERIPRSVYRQRWPKAEVIDFDTTMADDYDREWATEEDVLIAEYWYIEPETKKIYLLSDGSVVNAEDFDPYREQFANPPVDPATGQPKFETITVKQDGNGNEMVREVETNCVYSCMVSGVGKLEEPVKWAGTMIPIVPQWGDLITIDGKQIYSGMTRFGRDSQTIHNFEMSSMVEVVAKLPNMPFKATPAMIKGLESYYERLGVDDPPVLLYNADPQVPGGPSREPMAQMPMALANIAGISTDALKATLGIYDASIGNKSNEQSGRAIMARQTEGEVANFVYIDNQVKALKRVGEILVDAIPGYYDAERSIRILGEDLGEKYVKINHPVIGEDGKVHVINDLSRGKYDVTCTVGKNFDTARMELADTAQALANTPGPVGAISQWLLLKSLDVPGIDVAVEAVRTALVKQGILPPADGDQPPAPPQPDPLKMADAQHRMSQAALNQAKAQEIAAKTPAQVDEIQAKTAETVSKIPGHEAAGHQTIIQNGQALMAPMGTPLQGAQLAAPDLSDSYQGGY